MQIVYATGRPGYLEFAIASRSEAVPAGADIYATCARERVTEHLDEYTFNALTEQEFYEFRELVAEAHGRELQKSAGAN